MAKNVSIIVSGMGLASGFVTALDKARKSAGVSDEDFHEAIKEDSPLIAKFVGLLAEGLKKGKNVFSVFVEYGRSVSDLVAAGNYDWKNGDVNDKNFPNLQSGSHTTDIALVHLNRLASTEEILRELDRQGLKPADLHALLSLGAKYPDLQREFPIAALGSVWQGRDGDRLVPYLGRSGSERDLSLCRTGNDWREYYRFAAVRK